METLFIYFAKVIVCSGVMFLYYRIFLKDKTFHHYNRFYLLGTLVVSLLLPLLKVDYFTINVNQNIYELLLLLQNNSTSNISANDFSIYPIIFAILALVAVFFVAKFGFALWKINQFKKEYPEEKLEGISFYMTNLENAPFSFFRNLFWKNSILLQSDLGKQILKHEMVHIEQKHSYDKMFIEILTAVFWFNPIFYLIKKELNLIHEYLADKKALKNSDTKAFAQMLLETHFSGNILPGTSPFLNSNLKKRIIMLKKSNTKFAYFRKVFALPLLFCLVFVYMVKAENGEIKKSNKIISQQISALQNTNFKTDSIAYGVDGTALYEEHPELFFESEEAYNQHLLNKKKVDTISPKNSTKKAETYKVTASFLDSDAENPMMEELKNSANSDSFRIDDEKVSKSDFQEFFKKNIESEDVSFGFGKSAMDTPNPIKFFYAIKKENSEKVSAVLKLRALEAYKNYKTNIETSANKENQYIIGNSTITPPQSKKESSAITKKDNPWIIGVKAIAPPQKVSKTENSGYYSGTSVWIDNGNSKKEISDLTEEELLKLKIYVNAKETDWKTLKEQNPKLIKLLLEKHNNKNDVDKMK